MPLAFWLQKHTENPGVDYKETHFPKKAQVNVNNIFLPHIIMNCNADEVCTMEILLCHLVHKAYGHPVSLISSLPEIRCLKRAVY